MKFVALLAGAATLAGVIASPTNSGNVAVKKRKSSFQFTGVNESGAEFGNTAIPGQLGKDYTWPVHSSIDTMVGKGMNIFRIPIMMERLIPSSMTGSINSTYASALDDIVSYITSKGAYAIIDPHNFGRYYSNIITDASGFGAWWSTVAKRYASNSNVIFDTNNEFHDEDNSVVAQMNQAAITAIRAAGATSQYIFVEGNSYSGAWTWVSSGTSSAMGSLTDPSNKLIYEMHQYLDSDGSGTSSTCVSSTIGQERLVAATSWLKSNGKIGIIGELAGGANSQCITALQGMLSYMESNSDVWKGWLWWGGGPWWGDYIFGMEPPSGTAYTGVLPSITQYI